MSTTLRLAVHTEPRWGSDVTGCLHVLVDADDRVVDVRLDDVPGDLRQTACLEAAVRSALVDAGAPARPATLGIDADRLRGATAADLREALLAALGGAAGG